MRNYYTNEQRISVLRDMLIAGKHREADKQAWEWIKKGKFAVMEFLQYQNLVRTFHTHNPLGMLVFGGPPKLPEL